MQAYTSLTIFSASGDIIRTPTPFIHLYLGPYYLYSSFLPAVHFQNPDTRTPSLTLHPLMSLSCQRRKNLHTRPGHNWPCRVRVGSEHTTDARRMMHGFVRITDVVMHIRNKYNGDKYIDYHIFPFF